MLTPEKGRFMSPRQFTRPPVSAPARRVGLAAALVLAFAAPASAAIVPGTGASGVRLDDSQAQVKKVLGAPEKGSNTLNYRYLSRHGLGIYFIAGKAFEITVVRGREATSSGVRIGSTLAAVKKAYRKARCAPSVANRRVTECRLKGSFKGRGTQTVFTVKSGKVATIAVRFA